MAEAGSVHHSTIKYASFLGVLLAQVCSLWSSTSSDQNAVCIVLRTTISINVSGGCCGKELFSLEIKFTVHLEGIVFTMTQETLFTTTLIKDFSSSVNKKNTSGVAAQTDRMLVNYSTFEGNE